VTLVARREDRREALVNRLGEDRALAVPPSR